MQLGQLGRQVVIVSKLANLAETDLSSIQKHEQRRNNINKAQAETLYKIARVLGCNIEDLLEN